MPHIKINNTDIYYEDSAPDEQQKPVMLFAHGLLWNTRLFKNQVEHFKDDYRCIAFDFRGQGKSQIAKDGYDMDTLADDAIELLNTLNVDSCHYVGLSMGGFVGQRVAIKRPDLLNTLTLIDTSADAEDPENVPGYKKLLMAIRLLGMKRVSKKVMPIMFGATFLADKTQKAARKEWLSVLQTNRKGGVVKATTGVIERKGILDQLGHITTPTLIIVGDEDVATPYSKAERMHFGIKSSKLAVIKGSGHTSTVEAPDAVNTVMSKFLASQSQS